MIVDPRLRCMSALRFLQQFGEVAGAVLLDPPSHLGIGESEDDTPVDEQILHLRPIAEEVARVLRPGGASIFLGEPLGVSAWEVVAGWAGLRLAAELVVLWDEGVNKRSLGSLESLIITTTVRQHVKPGYRGSRPSYLTPSNVLVCHRVLPEDRRAPTQRPVELYNYLISLLTTPGDLIVDPYCGTGSSLVAAEMVGRPWVGGDVDPKMVEIAEKRLQHVELEEAGLQPLHLWTRGRLIAIEGA